VERGPELVDKEIFHQEGRRVKGFAGSQGKEGSQTIPFSDDNQKVGKREKGRYEHR